MKKTTRWAVIVAILSTLGSMFYDKITNPFIEKIIRNIRNLLTPFVNAVGEGCKAAEEKRKELKKK